MKTGKILILGAGAIGAGYLLTQVIKLKDTGDSLETSLANPRITKLDLSGLYFRTNVNLKNPTNNQVKISQPFVRLTSNGSLLASSNVGTETTIIKPKQTTQLAKDVDITLPWSKLLPYANDIISLVSGFIASWKSGDNDNLKKRLAEITPMEMTYSTTVNDTINYTSEPVKIL